MNDQINEQPNNNPYAAPTAEVGFVPDREEADFIPGGRSVPVGNSIAWISASWELFKRQPGTWVGFVVAYFVIALGLSLLGKIPLIGIIANICVVCLPILLVAGVVYSCDLLRREGKFAFGDLFIALKRQTVPLLLVCLLALGFFIVITILSGVFFVGMMGVQASLSTGIGMALVGTLIFIVISALYGMAIWFAPALIIMHNATPLAAVKASFSACRKNIPAGIVFFIAMCVLMFISAIPLGLGLLVTMPMMFICYYTTYRDVFFDVK
ncbi:MAG: hypothetical protein LBU76_07590 [Azoarcus sp.]|nr:hypothetical protein [Azoarcus sp.]